MPDADDLKEGKKYYADVPQETCLLYTSDAADEVVPV